MGWYICTYKTKEIRCTSFCCLTIKRPFRWRASVYIPIQNANDGNVSWCIVLNLLKWCYNLISIANTNPKYTKPAAVDADCSTVQHASKAKIHKALSYENIWKPVCIVWCISRSTSVEGYNFGFVLNIIWRNIVECRRSFQRPIGNLFCGIFKAYNIYNTYRLA